MIQTRWQQALVIWLLVLGAALWFYIGGGRWGSSAQVIGLVFVLVASSFPFVHDRVAARIDRLRHPSRQVMLWLSVAIFVISAGYLLSAAVRQDRYLEPSWHDQQMHAVQMQHLARGRLWLPQHPLADFFDTFYVLVKPVYAAIYFPGASLLYVPTVWLGLPYWLIPLLASAALVTVLFRVISQMIDAVAGLLAALLLLSLHVFRHVSVIMMSHAVFTLLALLMVWAWLRWRRDGWAEWAAAAGLFAGWAAITRPVDAICFALPVAVAFALDLRKQPLRRWIITLSAGCAAAAPFLAVQLIFNHGVTGSVWKTPIHLYFDQSMPGGTAFGKIDSELNDRLDVEYPTPQKRLFHQAIRESMYDRHATEGFLRGLGWRTLEVLYWTVPSLLLLLLFPTGLLALNRTPLLVLWFSLPLFIFLYRFNPAMLKHYSLMPAPAVILTVLLAGKVLVQTWPRRAAFLSTAFTLGTAALALGALPELDRHVIDDYGATELRTINELLSSKVQAPAVVLFRFGGGSHDDEPVYNFDTGWPDDAAVIRAHDLGAAKNIELLKYYAQRQPQRRLYVVDRRDLATFRYVGRAGELWAQIRAGTMPATVLTAIATSEPASQPTSEPAS